MDWSRQSLTFRFAQPPRSAARVVAARLGVVLEERHPAQEGVSFHARGPGEETIGVMMVDVGDASSGVESAEPSAMSVVPVLPGSTIVRVHATGRAKSVIDALTGVGFVLTGREPFPPAWVQEADAAWQRLLPELRAEGWHIELTCFAAPIQLEGKVPGGDWFYYRCRWNTCSLSVGGDDPADGAVWSGERKVDGAHAASHLHPDEAVRILLELHARWLLQPGTG